VVERRVLLVDPATPLQLPSSVDEGTVMKRNTTALMIDAFAACSSLYTAKNTMDNPR
jgi:hypothetical protein